MEWFTMCLIETGKVSGFDKKTMTTQETGVLIPRFLSLSLPPFPLSPSRLPCRNSQNNKGKAGERERGCGERRGGGGGVREYTTICTHIPPYTFVYLHIPSYIFIYSHIPSYASKYPISKIWGPTWDPQVIISRAIECFPKWEFDTLLPNMSPKFLVHPKWRQIYLSYEFQGVEGGSPESI